MKRSVGLLALMHGIFTGAASAATVTVTYGGVSVTPAPSTWMLMGLGLLITFIAFRKMHSLPVGRSLAAIVMLGGLSLSEVFTGHSLIPKAAAIVVPSENLSGGNPLAFALANGQVAFVSNDTGSTQQIEGLVVSTPDFLVTPIITSSPQCQVGLILAPGNGCYVQLDGVAA